ncbi:hypothetical protein EVAR_103024_1 [Eumeta japonica]|uniref:Uncharacterized protein n=1 Tax=Eumeta variegata TaxID=151549 RepID=A0A4C1WDZ4_EUMVA|nr:hypothetical protein EVAR_103024_1 [Eumeta japonica]
MGDGRDLDGSLRYWNAVGIRDVLALLDTFRAESYGPRQNDGPAARVHQGVCLKPAFGAPRCLSLARPPALAAPLRIIPYGGRCAPALAHLPISARYRNFDGLPRHNQPM